MSRNNKKYVCIHGHFYQPPRENPWLNKVEVQDSAYPYHDWNHRINAECYSRNTASRILNEEGAILDIINNYSRMSFNIGPTLLTWMETEVPHIYEAVLQADKESREYFSGHGSAIAQAYNHLIMPLANRRDKETQVKWGIEDFKRRFGRDPEGMWLGETAANTETLEVLAENGIAFTILSPYQARRFRRKDENDWQDGTNAKINPRHSYVYNLPSGKKINLFFYDGPASQAVAFEGLLNNGEAFAQRLLGQFTDEEIPQLVHIATDGESYGHHHELGEMALSYCLHTIKEAHPDQQLTIYAEYLEKHPPEHEVEILENTSWSCYHGVERWKSDCGCNTGGNKGWNQEWRKPLRETFDWLRDTCVVLYEEEMKAFTKNPWDVRNKYIRVVADRADENVESFLRENFGQELEDEQQIKLLKLLEMQYHCMLMYTSCGWFFDEVTGIESMQDILYATRAMQLAEEVSGNKYEDEFVRHLENIPSNIRKYDNAAIAYNRHVKPMMVNMLRVGAHFAVSSIFEEFPEELAIYSFNTHSLKREFYEAGKQKLVIGRVLLQSQITREKTDISYAVIHLGEHHLFGGVRPYISTDALNELHDSIVQAFHKSGIYEIFNLMDKYFGSHNYSFWHLFRDDQRKIMDLVTEQTMQHVEGAIYQLYESNFPLLQVYNEINMQVPRQLRIPMELAVNTRLVNIFKQEKINLEVLKKMLESAGKINMKLDFITLNFLADEQVAKEMQHLAEDPKNLEQLKYVATLLSYIEKSGMEPGYWNAQNIAYQIRAQVYGEYMDRCETGDNDAGNWCALFNETYKRLNLII
ncbi:MAG: DUF3536 domain-containing protein [Bacteroidia bacterium]